MNRLHMDRDTLTVLLQTGDVTKLSFDEIVSLFREEKLAQELPDGSFQIDPRTDDRIVYHAARSIRPHDNQPQPDIEHVGEKDCVICDGNTTGILDVAVLSEGVTFINKNLYPVLFPHGGHGDQPTFKAGHSAAGLHFLQWTSSYHDRDWHNLSVEDCSIVMSRLAALEHTLIEKSPRGLAVDPDSELMDGGGHVLIFKNYGHLVGASLSHGHQQIVYSNLTPARTLDHLRFQTEHDEVLSSRLLRLNPTELMIKEYGQAVLLVPAFMRRPYQMFLVMKDTRKRYLYELTADERASAGEGWHEATWLIHHMMPRMGLDIAYNIMAHTGPGAGIYFDFLPYTQPMGGLERIGLYVCQETPNRVADSLREALKSKRAL